MKLIKMNVSFALVVASIFVVCGCHRLSQEVVSDATLAPVAVSIAPVEARPIREMISAPGTYEPPQGGIANLSAPNTGRIAQIFVKEGDFVRKGQLLGMLELGVASAQNKSALAGVLAAKAQLHQAILNAKLAEVDQKSMVSTAKAGVNEAKAQSASDISKAQVNLDSARSNWETIQLGPRPQEIAQAKQAVNSAKADLIKAQKGLARTEELAKVGFASKQQLEDAQATEQVANANYSSASQALSLLKAGPRQEVRKLAHESLLGAQNELIAAKQLGNEQIARSKAALSQAIAGQNAVSAKLQESEAARALYEQKQADAGAAGSNLSQYEITAPFDGIITHRYLNPGDLADPTTKVLQISAGGTTDFVAKVTAAQAQLITPGMEAEVKADGSQKSITEKVASVSPADPSSGMSTVRIIGSNQAISGSGGIAEIVIKTFPNAIAIPNDAIVQRDGSTYAFLDNNGIAKQTEIVIGSADGNFTQIKNGLKAGDQIVRLGQYELDDGTKIKPKLAVTYKSGVTSN